MNAVREFDLGLDLRTAAYACALQKIYTVYLAAGITFSWNENLFYYIFVLVQL